ncbi:patatin-like phospholipase domain-containing protein [Haloechinothrix halophila]|uniref:patatin-like phospholipase family protein n=1 Tax=Haloechinothrix halophila TaxID=1069073 RepID=UPI00040A66EF|nr:patatin-like phospholipase family protein [Haloechinothrix halophila]
MDRDNQPPTEPTGPATQQPTSPPTGPGPAAGRVRTPGRAAAISIALAALAFPLAGWGLYAATAPRVDVIAIALGGSGQPLPLPDGLPGALWWDFAFLACYGAGLLLGSTAARWVASTPRQRRMAGFAQFAAVTVVVAGVVKNVLLLTHTTSAIWLLDIATAATVLMVAALLPAAPVALAGAVIVLKRARPHPASRIMALRADDVRPGEPLELDDPPVLRETTADSGDAARWRAGYRVPGVDPVDVSRRFAQGDDTVGFCLSGGGIRAASVAMGALQTLRSELLGARYLVSVSGGGYTAGALQQALTDAVNDERFTGTSDDTVLRDPEHAYQHGTAEENHVRRHSAYLADTPWEVVAALGVLARGLLLSLFLLFAPAVVLGVLAGWFYRTVPLTPIGDVVPQPRAGALYLLVALVVVVFLLSRYAQVAARTPQGERAQRAASALTGLTLVFAALTLVIPSLIGIAEWILAERELTIAVGGPIGTVVLTYLTTLVSIVWKHRTRITGRFGNRGKDGEVVTGAVPSGLLQRVLVVVTLGVLGAAWLLLFAGSATVSGDAALWTAGVVGVLLLAIGIGFDETSLSLHPFYRERLADAFAVRAVRRGRDDRIVAVPYRSTELTSLSTYGARGEGLRFPQVIFAAAAHLTGESRTPPGLNCVSYTMSADWVGGPDVGWTATPWLENVVAERFRRDLTVQGAVASSGAAFASAMGRAARWYQTLLAVSGARLGTWLPNPGYLHASANSGDWARQPLPTARRLPYLLKEVCGIHSHDDRLLHVTDGGHYDNLGLVELFRRRCTMIYCIDASGDRPPTATALAEALRLAQHELGVRVELDQPWPGDIEPGSGTALPPENPLSALNARLVTSPVIRGTVLYPPESGLDGVAGRIVIAKALLWPELPYPLLAYAAKHPEFPHDSTGDQWFGEAKFSAYTELGRRLGERVLHPRAAARAAARQAVGTAQSST